MAHPAIQAVGLGKQYRVGGPARGYRTVRESVSQLLRAPHRAWRRDRQSQERFWALKDVSLEIGQGEVLGIIGRNGAGKSTLLKVLSRITEPTEGWAAIRGRVGSLLEVGTGFHPELTGRENVFLSGAILGMKRREIQARFDQIVAFAEVERFIDTPLKHYSSGMYLRLAFAVAAHLEPAILMVDEVLAVGDLAFQRKCLGKMQEAGESGQTVLFVSHDLTAISRLAPTAVVLDGGRIDFFGPASQGIARYAQQRSASIGSLDSRLDRRGDGIVRLSSLRFQSDDGQLVDSVGSGEPLNLVIGYASALPRLSFEDLALDVRIADLLGHPIATVSTRFGRFDQKRTLPPCGALVCRISSLALASETYSIDLWLAYKGGLADAISGAGEISVIPAAYYETGDEPVKRKHGAALIRHGWTATELEQELVSIDGRGIGDDTK